MRHAALVLAVLLAGCAAERAGTRLQYIGERSGGQILLVRATDFPDGDVTAGRPTTAGSAALRDAVIADDGVAAFVRERGIPDAVAVEPLALRLHFAYLATGTAYTLEHSAAEVVTPRAMHDSRVVAERPLSEAEIDFIDPERRVVRQAEALRTLVDAYGRVQMVGRALVMTLPAAGEPGESYGMLLLKPSPATARLYGVDEGAAERVVAWVNPAGPLGGRLQVGDRVTAVDGVAIGVHDKTGGIRPGGGKRLTVRRGAETLEIEAVPERWPRQVMFVVLPESQPNAMAVEGAIGVTMGLIELLPSDDALAFVVGHELAHLSEGHVERKVTPGSVLKGLVTVGVLLPADLVVPGTGTLLGAAMQGVENRFNRDQERDADRIGVRYATAAGYDGTAAVAFMDLMEEKAPVGGVAQFLDIHPPYPERRALLEKAAAAH